MKVVVQDVLRPSPSPLTPRAVPDVIKISPFVNTKKSWDNEDPGCLPLVRDDPRVLHPGGHHSPRVFCIHHRGTQETHR